MTRHNALYESQAAPGAGKPDFLFTPHSLIMQEIVEELIG
jgi:hypothetical protein